MKKQFVVSVFIFIFLSFVYTSVFSQSSAGDLAIGPLYNNEILLSNRTFSVEIVDNSARLSEAFFVTSDSSGVIMLENLAIGEWIWRIGCTPEYVTNSSGVQSFGSGEYKNFCVNLATIVNQPNAESISVSNSAPSNTRFWGGSIVLLPN